MSTNIVHKLLLVSPGNKLCYMWSPKALEGEGVSAIGGEGFCVGFALIN